MKRPLKRLQPKHLKIVQLAFQGWPNTRIASEVGARRETVSRVLHSPPALVELERLKEETETWMVTPWLVDSLARKLLEVPAEERSREAVRLRRTYRELLRQASGS